MVEIVTSEPKTSRMADMFIVHLGILIAKIYRPTQSMFLEDKYEPKTRENPNLNFTFVKKIEILNSIE